MSIRSIPIVIGEKQLGRKELVFGQFSENFTIDQYAHIDGLFKESTDWNLIRTNWRDLMRIALSIYTGSISWAIQLRKLSHEHCFLVRSQ